MKAILFGSIATLIETSDLQREAFNQAFKEAGLNWEDYVITSEKYFRPNEVEYLLGDYKKAEKALGWKPQTQFADLVKIMVESDLELAKREEVLIKNNLLEPTWEHPIT